MKRRIIVAATAAAALSAGSPAASANDMACFGSLRSGVVCAKDGKFEAHTRENRKLASNSVSGMAACGDRIVIASSGALQSFDGKEWSPPLRPPGGFASRVACAGPGKYWVTLTAGAAHYDGAAWKIYDMKAILGEGAAGSIFDIASPGDGTAWIVLSNGMAARFENDKWTVFKEGQGFDKRHPFTRIFVDGKGHAWLPAGGSVLSFRDGKWATLMGLTGFTAMAGDAQGRIFLGSGTKVNVLDGDRRAEFAQEGSIRAMALDGAGALWIATDFGIARLADGKIESRHMHDSPLPENDFNFVAAVGKGSALPPVAEQPQGSLAGRLEWSDGKPVDKAQMQICGVTAALVSGADGPCGKRPLFAAATTDAEGKFEFAKVPAASYRLAVKAAGAERWIVFLGTSDRLRVMPGENKNSGTLSVDVRHRGQK